MISVRNNKYEYKIISSFYDNYKKQHQYDFIKQVVLGLISNNCPQAQIIKRMQQLYLLCDTTGINDCPILIKHFEYIGQTKITSTTEKTILISFSVYSTDPIQAILLLIDEAKRVSEWESFFCYVLATLLINDFYGEYIVFPVYLLDEIDKIKDSSIRNAFFDGHIQRVCKRPKNINTLNKVAVVYEQYRTYFHEHGLDNIYLFGSIAKKEDTEYSDIDLVLQLSTTNDDDIANAILIVKEFNQKHFNKKSDIHLYDEFIEQNPSISLYQLI